MFPVTFYAAVHLNLNRKYYKYTHNFEREPDVDEILEIRKDMYYHLKRIVNADHFIYAPIPQEKYEKMIQEGEVSEKDFIEVVSLG
ncbi:hypothetical protein DNHGIG_07550 [Collibacillus ludicampi]|jgi:hypothetical protein|uniref:Uncharacterized protein n=1 Tax=Collibacillus ludicampi TaxID=2771369 RepID=A0AAV4LBX3_9BACL|nr:hypothetical protein [Collibacillus ludicampi]GIM45206.1 hypothetical protein DNHGIG_07550 [Collibacillus ludicampi]